MALKTGDEYVQSIKSLGLEAQVMGRKTGDLTEHPLVDPSLCAIAATFDGAHSESEETRGLFRASSSICGEEVSRFTHLHQSAQDLIDKVRLQRHCGNVTACCFQRCVGLDAANAVFSVSFECDQERGTSYHERFREFWSRVQLEDLVVDGAMTDPKGDRAKRPSEQKRSRPLSPRGGAEAGRRGRPRRQAAPDRHAEFPRDHRDAHDRHAAG